MPPLHLSMLFSGAASILQTKAIKNYLTMAIGRSKKVANILLPEIIPRWLLSLLDKTSILPIQGLKLLELIQIVLV